MLHLLSQSELNLCLRSLFILLVKLVFLVCPSELIDQPPNFLINLLLFFLNLVPFRIRAEMIRVSVKLHVVISHKSLKFEIRARSFVDYHLESLIDLHPILLNNFRDQDWLCGQILSNQFPKLMIFDLIFLKNFFQLFIADYQLFIIFVLKPVQP